MGIPRSRWNIEAAHDSRREQGRQDRLEREEEAPEDGLDPVDEDLSSEEEALREHQEESMDEYYRGVPRDNL